MHVRENTNEMDANNEITQVVKLADATCSRSWQPGVEREGEKRLAASIVKSKILNFHPQPTKYILTLDTGIAILLNPYPEGQKP